MRRGLVWTLAALVVAALIWLVSHFLEGRSGPRRGSSLRVFFTGEAMGELEPCNCSGKEAGGLPALGGFLAAQDGERLLLDVGCIGRGARDFEVLRLQAVLRGMAAMGYDGANVGEYELWLGRDELAAQFALGVPFTSANVTDESGKAVATRFLLLRKAGLRIAVTGLVAADRYLAGPGLRVDDPREALARILPALRREADAVVVLADLDVETVRQLCAEFPEISLVLYRGRGDSHPPERVNRSIVASVSGQVRYAGVVNLSWGDDLALAAEGLPVLLDDRLPPSPEATEAADRVRSDSIGWYKRAIEGRRFDLAQARPGWQRLAKGQAREEDKYVGSEACRACHVASYAIWERSAHARAFEPIEKAGYQYSPECVVCHVVDYGAPDGYVLKKDTPALASVGCESCHGRGRRHVEAQGKNIGSLVRGGEATCGPCHTQEHSRGFVYERAWPKIAHKEPREKPPDGGRAGLIRRGAETPRPRAETPRPQGEERVVMAQ